MRYCAAHCSFAPPRPRAEGFRPSAPGGVAQQVPGDDHPLDLARALVELGDLGVAVEALGRELGRVARSRRGSARPRRPPRPRRRWRTAWPWRRPPSAARRRRAARRRAGSGGAPRRAWRPRRPAGTARPGTGRSGRRTRCARGRRSTASSSGRAGDAAGLGGDRDAPAVERGQGQLEPLVLGAQHAGRARGGTRRRTAPPSTRCAGPSSGSRGPPSKPGPGSATKALTPFGPGPPVRANRMNRLAKPPLVIHCLAPSTTQASPSRGGPGADARGVRAGVGLGQRVGARSAGRSRRRGASARAAPACRRAGAARPPGRSARRSPSRCRRRPRAISSTTRQSEV